jgi:hypothetical protein
VSVMELDGVIRELRAQLDETRAENARLTRERDEAHAKYLAAIEANEEWHQVVIKLRAAIAPTEENVEALARLFAHRLDECPWEEWIEEAQRGFRVDAAAAFAAINERAKL